VKRNEKVALTDAEHDDIIYSLIDYTLKFKLTNVIKELMALLKQPTTQKYYEYAIHICTISNEDTELDTYISGLHALGVKLAPQLNIKVGNIFYTNLNYKKAES
jgi:hypothetical protein